MDENIPTAQVPVEEVPPQPQPVAPVPVTPPQPTVPVELVTPQIPKPKSKILIILLAVLVLVVLGIAGVFVYGKYISKISPSPTPQPTSITSPTPTMDPTANWQTHKVPGLGIELKLPGFFSPLDYPNGNEMNGEKGKQFCIEYIKVDIVSFFIKNVIAGSGPCHPQYFGLGTTSVDYEAGRMGGFGDLQGYTFENGVYFAKMNLGKRFEIPTELAKEITNSNGIKILRVIGKNSQPTEQGIQAFPIAGTPGDGRLGALVNLDNVTYPGVSIEMKLEGNLNIELFDQILSTFKFTQ